MIAEDLGIGSIKAGTRDLRTDLTISAEFGGDVYVTPSTPKEGRPLHYGNYIYDTKTGKTLRAKENKENGTGKQ